MKISDVPKEDWNQIFVNGIVRHIKSGLLCVITAFDGGECYFTTKNCRPGQSLTDKFNDDVFDVSPIPLGYVNFDLTCVYTYRIAKRVMSGTVNTRTISYNYPAVLLDSLQALGNGGILHLGEGWEAMTRREYPTLSDCVSRFATNPKIAGIAFDRQFCIVADGRIFYLDKIVGKLPKGATSEEEIVWNTGCENMINLIGVRYVEALRSSKKAPAVRSRRT